MPIPRAVASGPDGLRAQPGGILTSPDISGRTRTVASGIPPVSGNSRRSKPTATDMTTLAVTSGEAQAFSRSRLQAV